MMTERDNVADDVARHSSRGRTWCARTAGVVAALYTVGFAAVTMGWRIDAFYAVHALPQPQIEKIAVVSDWRTEGEVSSGTDAGVPVRFRTATITSRCVILVVDELEDSKGIRRFDFNRSSTRLRMTPVLMLYVTGLPIAVLVGAAVSVVLRECAKRWRAVRAVRGFDVVPPR